MEYIASVKDSEGNTIILKYEYQTKADFKKDIHANGYKINYGYIFTATEYQHFIDEQPEFMSWFITRLEKRRTQSRINNGIRKVRRETKKLYL